MYASQHASTTLHGVERQTNIVQPLITITTLNSSLQFGLRIFLLERIRTSNREDLLAPTTPMQQL